MKKILLSLTFLILPIFLNISATYAVENVPPVNLNESPNASNPKSGFRLVICDGPAALNDPKTHMIRDTSAVTTGASTGWKVDPTWKQLPADQFIPCNFQGLMKQAQFLINAMIVLGVLGALIGFSYAGYLYITGTQGNLERAHSIFPKVFWGFIIMLTAWFMVSQLLTWLTGNANYLSGTVS